MGQLATEQVSTIKELTPSAKNGKVELDLDFSVMSVEEVADGIRNQKFSSEKVLTYFLNKAKVVNEKYNCVTQFLDDTALQAAKEIDRKLTEGDVFDKETFPLLGVPISIKDTIDIKGLATVAGYRSQLDKLAESDAHVVSILRRCGGIPFCKTNVPQFCMSAESSNPIYGTTLNPNNVKYTPGGSSSGEASLIKAGGSLLGIGSDISGSLRIPAHFCGIYSFKPTSIRFPNQGHIVLCEGQDNLKLTMGPMANKAEDLQYLFQSVLNKQPWNDFTSEVTPIPYTPTDFKDRKLRIGVLYTDKLFPPTPAVKRALDETVTKLTSSGHECIPITYDRIEEINFIVSNLILQDSFAGVISKLSGEGFDPTIKEFLKPILLPSFVKIALGKLVKYLFGQHFVHDIFTNAGSLNISGLLHIHHKRDELKHNLLKVWDTNNLDCILLPTLPFPAFKIGEFNKCSIGYSHCSTFNAFDMPAAVLPVTKVDKELDHMGDVKTWLKQNLEEKEFNQGTWFQQDVYSTYNPEEMHGLPIGLQLVGKKFQDEKLLEIVKIVDRCVHSEKSKLELGK